jgi:hypothetical protein
MTGAELTKGGREGREEELAEGGEGGRREGGWTLRRLTLFNMKTDMSELFSPKAVFPQVRQDCKTGWMMHSRTWLIEMSSSPEEAARLVISGEGEG